MPASISFDRAAEYYDKTRGLPDETARALTQMLAGELGARGAVLEIGVGTGRIAIPLANEGIPVTGVDLSTEMLARLRDKDPSRKVAIAVADATRVPFGDSTFGAAIVCHVFHLIPAWTGAVAELCRTVRGGGTVVVERGGAVQPYKDVTDELMRRSGHAQRNVGLDVWNDDHALRSLDEAFGEHGGTPRDLPPVPYSDTGSLEDLFKGFVDGIYGWTWSIEESKRREVADETRQWAEQRFGPLDRKITVDRPLTWRAYDVTKAS